MSCAFMKALPQGADGLRFQVGLVADAFVLQM
jgi:hypothetical protein